MQFKTLAFLSILSILFFTSCSSNNSDENNNVKKEQVSKSDEKKIQLKTINNKTITILKKDENYHIKEYENKIVLLNFFATWCSPCKAEIPNLVKLKTKYSKDFEVVSVLLEKDKTNEEILEFANKFSINYPVTNSTQNYDLAKTLGSINSIPAMFMLAKDGSIYQKYVGIVPNEMMEIDIKKLLKK